jgi:hypothetical protein
MLLGGLFKSPYRLCTISKPGQSPYTRLKPATHAWAQASPSFSLLSEALDLMKMRLFDFLVVRSRAWAG